MNAAKTKVMICGAGLDILRKSGKFPCAVCRTGVGNSSIQCSACNQWVHKKCSGLKRIVANPTFQCARCLGTARPIDGRPWESVQVGTDTLEVVDAFCYLGDMLSAGGGCELATVTRTMSAWKKFRELLPVLTSRHFSLKTRGRIYSTCVRSVMLHASETWPLTKPDLQRLQRNDRAMIRQICGIQAKDISSVRSMSLLGKLGLADLECVLRERRLRWRGHVERSNGAIKIAKDLVVEGRRGPGRPKMSWSEVTTRDCKQWNLTSVDPCDKTAWKSAVRGAMAAASQIPG